MNEGLEISKHKHLAPGVKPIFVCVGSPKDYGFKKPYFLRRFSNNNGFYKINLKLSNVKNVNWREGTYESKAEKFLTAGPQTYTISAIDDSNKFSEGFFRCVGLIVAGIDKQTGKNVSFLSHQDPNEFLSKKKEEFTMHLKKRFLEIVERCKPNTVDAVIVGGIYFSDNEIDNNYIEQRYPNAITLLETQVQQNLGFEPIVIGPKISYKWDDVYYDNENRRLYLIRPKVNPNTGSFPASDIKNQEKKWK